MSNGTNCFIFRVLSDRCFTSLASGEVSIGRLHFQKCRKRWGRFFSMTSLIEHKYAQKTNLTSLFAVSFPKSLLLSFSSSAVGFGPYKLASSSVNSTYLQHVRFPAGPFFLFVHISFCLKGYILQACYILVKKNIIPSNIK